MVVALLLDWNGVAGVNEMRKDEFVEPYCAIMCTGEDGGAVHRVSRCSSVSKYVHAYIVEANTYARGLRAYDLKLGVELWRHRRQH